MADEDVKGLLKTARETIEKQGQMLRELTADPWELATIIDIYDKTVIVANGGKVEEISRPKDIDAKSVGRVVRLSKLTGQIIQGSAPAISQWMAFGSSGVINKIEEGRITISTDQGPITITKSLVEGLKVGNSVQLCAGNQVVFSKLKEESQQVYSKPTGICWDDIGGLEEAKRELKEALELPYQFASVYKAFGRKPVKGFLLYGMPGNGKTMLGKAAATSLSVTHKKEHVGSGFLYVKGPELLSKWVGETESWIRKLFSHAREHQAAHGYPCLVFIDEADAILGQRGRHHTSGLEGTIVPQFLSEMDGLDESCAIVMLATNRSDMLDGAVVRPGRIDRKIHVGPPDAQAAPSYFAIHMREIPMEKGATCKTLADKATDYLYNGEFPLYNLKTSKGVVPFKLQDCVSGAFIAGVVERAVAKAVNRNIEAKSEKVAGLGWSDLESAVAAIYHEHKLGTHTQDLEFFAERNGLKIEAYQRV